MRRYLTLHQPDAARRYYEHGLWRHDTFYTLMRQHARSHGTHVAAVDSRRAVTWAELQRWADGIAATLKGYGLVPGDRVAVWMSSRLETVAVMLACSREGFACSPSFHRMQGCAQVVDLMRRLGARALFTEAGWGADRAEAGFDAMLAGLPDLRVVFDAASCPGPEENRTPHDTNPDKVVYLAFTGGTTGEPKCVMHSENTILANARELVRDWRVTAEARILPLSHLSHHVAWVAVAQWLLAGCRLIVNDPPPGTSAFEWIEQQNATYLLGVPTHAVDLLAEMERRGRGRGAIRVFYMAGAPIPASVCEALVARGIAPQNAYGMIENSSHNFTRPHDPPDVLTRTCGRAGRSYEVALFDPADPDRPVTGTGVMGQIGGRGAALMLGYFGRQDLTERSFNRDGWFMSGDLGILNAAGNLTIVGRTTDVIVRGGHHVHAAPLEALAVRHPKVRDAACFPLPDKRLGERVCIAVAGAAEPADLLSHLSRHGLSRLDLPEFFVRLERVPTNPSGAVVRRLLADMAARGAIRPVEIAAAR